MCYQEVAYQNQMHMWNRYSFFVSWFRMAAINFILHTVSLQNMDNCAIKGNTICYFVPLLMCVFLGDLNKSTGLTFFLKLINMCT